MHVEDLHNGWIAPGILHRDLTVVNHLGRQGLHRISEIFLLCGLDVESGISGCGCFRSSERILAFLLLQNRELVKLGRVEDLSGEQSDIRSHQITRSHASALRLILGPLGFLRLRLRFLRGLHLRFLRGFRLGILLIRLL